MYEMLFPDAAPDLAQRTLDVMHIPPANYRLRDAWIETGDNGEPVIRILTRIGGGNRGDYAQQITDLQQHPLYLSDQDETEWDATYASFYFRVPPGITGYARRNFEACAALNPAPVNMKQKADEALAEAAARWERGEFTPAEQAVQDKIRLEIEHGNGGIIEI